MATLATIVASAVAYFWRKKAEMARASKNLYLELQDTLASLDVTRFPNDFYHIGIRDRNGKYRVVYFMGRSLNHDFYDSLIYSGKINFLNPSIQQHVQDLFKRIKTHNTYVDVVFEMSVGGIVPTQGHKYCEWLHDSERYMQQELPEILESLRRGWRLF